MRSVEGLLSDALGLLIVKSANVLYKRPAHICDLLTYYNLIL